MKHNESQGDQSPIETYLSSFTPRSPELDLPEIACDELMLSCRTANVCQDNGLLLTKVPSTKSLRMWHAVAASWICGAAVGAAVMFYLTPQFGPAVATEKVEMVHDVVAVDAARDSIVIDSDASNSSEEAINIVSKRVSGKVQEYPDLITTAGLSQALPLRANLRFKKTSQVGPLMAVKQGRAIASPSNSAMSEMMRNIQIPERSNSTRESLLQELLSCTIPTLNSDCL